MENRDWEDFLNSLEGDLNPEGKVPDSGMSSDEPGLFNTGESTEDEILREKLAEYHPADEVEGWAKLAASLDAADEAFDHAVRNRIHHYHTAYDPHSWSKFAKRFSAHKHLRSRLIMLKVSEAAAIFLLMLTALHLGQEGRLPFQESLAAETMQSSNQEQPITAEDYTSANPQKWNSIKNTIDPLPSSNSKSTRPGKKSKHGFSTKESVKQEANNHLHELVISEHASSTGVSNPEMEASVNEEVFVLADPLPIVATISENNVSSTEHGSVPTVDFLATSTSSIDYVKPNPVPLPILVASTGKNFIEFGMMAQADYNQLKIPEDRLSSDGKQIVFPLQGITSPGFGAGFSLALGHPKWALETGVVYNSKTFKPGRELTIGGEADNSNVEYEAMHMQLISIPLQYRYRFDSKGRFKAYALAGFGLHVIAQSDIDVMVEYNFASLPEGEDPNNNPVFARTIRQAQRVSDDIRAQAPFSTNSYISANIGLGIEYAVAARKTLFLQTAYQYQIPNLRFSNHNGKHLLSLSLQAGVRTPLGS